MTEKESNPMVKITPVDLPPVTVERKINQLGLTLTKTYDKFAEAPIQGVDAAGRRTVIATMPVLPDSNKNHDVSLKLKKLALDLLQMV